MNNEEGRLEKLEKELRKTRRLALVLTAGALVALVLAVGLATAALVTAVGDRDVVTAKQFVLIDDVGRTRAVLAVLPSTEEFPALVLYDEHGAGRVGLTLVKDGPGLTLWDANGKLRASLYLEKNEPKLWLDDENGHHRVGLTEGGGGAGLMLTDDRGKIRASMCVTTGGPALFLCDPGGEVGWAAPY